MTTSEILLELAVKEYELLRAEVVSTVERQYSLANWGTSAIAVIVAAVIGGWQTVTGVPALPSVVFVVVIPSLMTSYVIAWSHTITKLNQLGVRLFEIEENIARLCTIDLIRGALNISASDEIRQCQYTIGWEHVLWKEGINNRIQTTIRVVGLMLAISFLIVTVGNSLYMAATGIFDPRANWLVTGICALFWGSTWLVIFRYLHRRTIDSTLLNKRPQTAPGAPSR